MRTTVNVPEELLLEVERLAKARSRREALIIALDDYVRRKRLQRVVDSEGELEFDLSAKQMRDSSNSRTDFHGNDD